MWKLWTFIDDDCKTGAWSIKIVISAIYVIVRVSNKIFMVINHLNPRIKENEEDDVDGLYEWQQFWCRHWRQLK